MNKFEQVYNALRIAIARINQDEYARQKKKNKNRHPKQFIPHPAANDLQQALNEMCYGKMDPEEAMLLLHGYKVMQARFPEKGQRQ